MEIVQTILFIIGQTAMIVLAIMLIRFLRSKYGREGVKDHKLALDYILSLIKLKDQYLAYGYEAEAKELDEQIKELLKKIEL